MYSLIFPNKFIKTFPGTTAQTRAVGSLAGVSLKLMNFTNYDIAVYVGADQVDILPAYQYLIMPNEPDLYVEMLVPASTNYVYPSGYVAAKTFDDVLAYEVGSLIHFMSQSPGDTVNVAGNMTIANTPNVNVSGGTMNVNITGTPSVNVANTASVTIANTPTVQLTATGNSVNIAGTPAVTVSGTPNMNVTNTSIPIANATGSTLNIAGQVNIGNTPAVTIANTPNVAITSGSVNATIQNASLNSNITNALINTGVTAASQAATNTITNLVTGGASPWFACILPLSMYDDVVVTVQMADNGVIAKNKYQASIQAFGISGVTFTDYISSALISAPGDNSHTWFTTLPNPISKGRAVFGSTIWITLVNISGATIVSDTVTVTAYAKYASQTVTNPSNQPVPISSNYYGTGADGNVTITANTNLNNTANVPAIYNYKSLTINSGVGLYFANQAKYAIIFCQGDVTINGNLFAPNGITNAAAPAIALAVNGKTVANAGNGGAGGTGSQLSGGAGGTGTCYAAGAGGGGGGGYINSGSASPAGPGGGGTGYGAAAAGVASNVTVLATNAPTYYSGTLCVVAGGNITINGQIWGAGTQGGRGAEVYYDGANYYTGGGGACGPNAGGNGYTGSHAAAGAIFCGGCGAGGAGGASVFIFAGGNVFNNGTINVNGGAGGIVGGTVNGASMAGGAAGQAGSITIYQLGGNLSGL